MLKLFFVVGAMLALLPLALAGESGLPITHNTSQPATAPAPQALKLPPVWRWGTMSLNPEGTILYIPQFNKTSVLEVATGKSLANLSDTSSGACAVAIVPQLGRGFVSNSWQGTVTVFDLKNQARVGEVGLGKKVGDAGPMVYEPVSGRIVDCQPGTRSLIFFPADIDLKNPKADEPIELEGNPESIVADDQGMVYIDYYSSQVSVVDARSMKLVTTWPIEAEGAFPDALGGMSIDRVHSRLYIACQAGVVIMSTTDGHEIARVLFRGGATATAYLDDKAYAHCPDGSVQVIGRNAAGEFEVQRTIKTPDLVGGSMALEPRSKSLFLSAIDRVTPNHQTPPAQSAAVEIVPLSAAP